MEPLLDKIERYKKTKPKFIRTVGVWMVFLPSLLFAILIPFGYDVMNPPGEKSFPTEFEPDPAFPTAFVFSLIIAACSPFVIFFGKPRTIKFLFTLLIWVLLVIQIFIINIISYFITNHGQWIRC